MKNLIADIRNITEVLEDKLKIEVLEDTFKEIKFNKFNLLIYLMESDQNEALTAWQG